MLDHLACGKISSVILHVCVCLQLMFFLTEGAQGQAVDDHGNDCLTATELEFDSAIQTDRTTIGLRGQISGAIDYPEDWDFFSVQLPVGGSFKIWSVGSTDTVGALLDENCGVIAFNDDSGVGSNFSISRTVSPGTYYGAVAHYSPNKTGSYTFRMRFAIPIPSSDDSNKCSEALTTYPETDPTVEAAIGYPGDVDFFRLRIKEDSLVKVYSSGEIDLVAELFDSDCEPVTSDDNSGEGDNFQFFQFLTEGYHPLSVRHTELMGMGPYTIHFEFLDDEQGESCSEAFDVELNSIQPSAINQPGDWDYFRLEVAEPGTLTAQTISDIDTVGILLDDSCEEVTRNDDSGEGDNFTIIQSLAPGTHFLGIGHFDPNGVGAYELSLAFEELAESTPDEVIIFFPKVQIDNNFGTGIALANPTDETAEVTLSLLQDSGELLRGDNIENPVHVAIPANNQTAKTIPELFGPGVNSFEGSVWGLCENLGVAGFFLSYTSDVGNIDGAEAIVLRPSSSLVFPEVFSEEGEVTELTVMGFGEVTLELVSADGALIESEALSLSGYPLERFSASLDEIFSSEIPSDCYVVARTSGDQIIGYESFGGEGFLAGRNAIPVRTLDTENPSALFGAQLADGSSIETTITIINPTSRQADLTVSAFRTGTSSTEPAGMATAKLKPKEMIKVNAREFLELPVGDFVGWLRVDSSVAGIVGDVTFGDPNRNFLSSVQLQELPLSDVVFSHVADGLGYMTGLTFLNVERDAANVTVEIFNVEGEQTGSTSFVLEPFEHRPRLLLDMVPDLEPQIGGYIRVTSDIGIFTFELFLYVPSGQILSMSAVPPQLGHGRIAGQVTPTSVAGYSVTVEELVNRKKRYQASYAKGIRLDPTADFVAGEAIVRLRAGISLIDLGRAVQSSGWASELGSNGLHLFRLREEVRSSMLHASSFRSSSSLVEPTLDFIESLNSNPAVLYAEPNYVRHLETIPDDPDYEFQWHYRQLNLPAAWNLSTGSADVIVAVIDSGAKFSHVDLAERLTAGGYDFVSDITRSLDGDGIDPLPEDPGIVFEDEWFFHGTHVAGTIGAMSDNGLGVAGVNWQSPLMTLRVIGRGGISTVFDVVQALKYAGNYYSTSGTLPPEKANVVNLSLGGYDYSESEAEIIAALQGRNIAVVASAGNESTTLRHFPSWYPGVISVGATGVSGELASYSNYGKRLDVVAPGGSSLGDDNGDGVPDSILSTSWNQPEGTSTYTYEIGTSMSAPHVTGVVSLMLSVNPALTPSEVGQILHDTAIDLGDPGKDDQYGYGLVNPVGALIAAGAVVSGESILLTTLDWMNFGFDRTQMTAVLFNGGGGSLQIDSPSVEVDAGEGWLSATLVNNSLFVEVDRSGLQKGEYSGRVRVSSNGGDVVITVRMDVGEPPTPNVEVHVRALSSQQMEVMSKNTTSPVSDFNYLLTPIPSGSYYVAAGTDLDEDGYFCDEGEYCGFYPIPDQPSLVGVRVNETTEAVDFVIRRNDQNGIQSLMKMSGEEGFRIVGASKQESLKFNLITSLTNREKPEKDPPVKCRPCSRP